VVALIFSMVGPFSGFWNDHSCVFHVLCELLTGAPLASMGCSWKPPQTIVENDRLAPTGPVVEVHKQAFGVSRFFMKGQ
jgi:hypothetical protein